MNETRKKILYLVMIEILTFYTQILTMVVFLFYIMIRGILGKKEYEPN